jgi:hypothetical protein
MMTQNKDKRVFLDALSKESNDMLATRYRKPTMLNAAQTLLNDEEVSEEAFLGAQGVLLIHGLL